MSFTAAFTGTDADLGTDFTAQTGADAWNRSSDEARESSAAAAAEYYNAASYTDDQYVQWLVGTGREDTVNFGCGGALRMATGAVTEYFCITNTAATGEIQVGKAVAGTPTIIASYTAGAAPASGDLMRFEVSGSGASTNLKAYHAGNLRIDNTGDTSIASGARIGMYGEPWNVVATLDTMEGGDIVTAPAAPIPGPRSFAIQQRAA